MSRKTGVVCALRSVAIVAAAFGAVSCGGGDEGGEPAPSAPNAGGQGNRGPSISGTAPGSVLQGTLFSFQPSASDADGDALTFSVSNLPPWAAFDTKTGLLQGTPGAGHVGSTYSNITISVTDGTAVASLPGFSVQVVATAAGSALLSWMPPTAREDGTPLGNGLAGYKIYWGTSPGNYTNSTEITNPGVTSYLVEQLTPATWYFVATAFDSNGVESAFSNVASKTVTAL